MPSPDDDVPVVGTPVMPVSLMVLPSFVITILRSNKKPLGPVGNEG